MNTNKESILWHILPYGAETQPEDSNANGSDNPTNSVAPQANSPATGAGSVNSNDDDDDDPYAGLSAKELRRILKDTESSKSRTESEKADLEKRIKEEEDKKLTKEQALEKSVSERDDIIATLRAANAKLAIINAINQDTRYQWHDAEIVAQQLNSSVVKVSDDGKVEGIAKELARVAKDHEYLLKKQVAQQNNGGQQEQSTNNQGPTGFQPGQGGANQGGTLGPNAAELAKNYPALANRL